MNANEQLPRRNLTVVDIELRPRILLVAGPNGTGKTTVTERGLAQQGN